MRIDIFVELKACFRSTQVGSSIVRCMLRAILLPVYWRDNKRGQDALQELSKCNGRSLKIVAPSLAQWEGAWLRRVLAALPIQLKELNLRGNSIPGEFGFGQVTRKALTELELSNNKFTNIIGQLPENINKLNLAGNNFTFESVASALKGLKELEQLNLSQNEFVPKSGTLEKLVRKIPSSLTSLSLDGNQLRINEAAANLMRKYDKLTKLSLANNELGKSEAYVVFLQKALPRNLETLDISGNDIAWINTKKIIWLNYPV